MYVVFLKIYITSAHASLCIVKHFGGVQMIEVCIQLLRHLRKHGRPHRWKLLACGGIEWS